MQKLQSKLRIFFVTLLIVGLGGCVIEDRQEDVNFNRSTIVDDILNNPDLNVLAAAMSHARILYPLESEESITFLAPSRALMDTLINDILETDTSWNTLTDIPNKILKRELNNIFQYHFLPNQIITTADITNGQIVVNSFGLGLEIFKTEDAILFSRVDNGNTTTIITPDLIEDNGVIHIVDSFLN